MMSVSWQFVIKKNQTNKKNKKRKPNVSSVNKGGPTEALPSVMNQVSRANDKCYLFHCYPGLFRLVWHQWTSHFGN